MRAASVAAKVAVCVLLLAGGCAGGSASDDQATSTGPDAAEPSATSRPEHGQLGARPLSRRLPPRAPDAYGLHAIRADDGAAGLLYVPEAYSPERPAPLVVALHGAGGRARAGFDLLQGLADEEALIVLAPQARGSTWDLIGEGGYGADVASVDSLLERVFERLAIDRSHVALAGFSDGASYALSLGITNGDLFTHLIAFSPGFVQPAAPRGEPAVYVSHGTGDSVLPIHLSRRIVPSLRRAGYEVLYREFDGRHTVPPEIAREAIGWLRRGRAAAPAAADGSARSRSAANPGS